MANLRIELNEAGIRELLKSDEIASVCQGVADSLTAATGVKYEFVDTNQRRMLKKEGGVRRICPKCGKWHPNCHCNETGGGTG